MGHHIRDRLGREQVYGAGGVRLPEAHATTARVKFGVVCRFVNFRATPGRASLSYSAVTHDY